MRKKPGGAFRIPHLAVVVIVLLGISSFSAVAVHVSAHGSSSNAFQKNALMFNHTVMFRPRYAHAGAAKQGAVFSCQLISQCYGPQQITAAYNIEPLLKSGFTGKGRTIVIIDPFQSPTIRQDLHLFDRTFGLSDPTLNIIAPNGLTPFDPNNADEVGWSGEISLDVEWAHAIAPGATIDLVLAKSDVDASVASATSYAITNNLGDIISQSFGETETCADPQLLKHEDSLFQRAAAQGISLLAASGDTGAAQPTCRGGSYFRGVSFPASDPYITGIGGTHLDADGLTGAYHGEEAWNEPATQGASGGGFSTIYARPSYQSGSDRYRGVPDVAYDAAVSSGVLTVWSSSGQGPGQVFVFGGTSVGTPEWSGIVAIADQYAHRRLGQLNPALYTIGRSSSYDQAFHDVTAGNNTFSGQNTSGATVTIKGYDAGPGWDPVTGLGTPNAYNLVPLLIQIVNTVG
jgi:subtilase family serine protease